MGEDNKVYVVYSKNVGRVRGFIRSKELYDLFKEQRNMENYDVVKVSPKKLGKIVEKEYLEASVLYGIVIFPEEEEFYNESFDQLLTDMEVSLERMVKNVLPFLKLEKTEYDIIYDFLKDVFTASHFLYNGDDIDPEKLFRIEHMIKVIIEDLN